MAGLVGTFAVRRISMRFLIEWIPAPIILAVAVLISLLCIAYIFIWVRDEKKGKTDSIERLAHWQGLLRYFIALDLSTIGWQKIFHLQFFTPLGVKDLPFSRFSGEQLTWAYFGYSYPFIVAIGIFQIIGSLLLLFQRTRLLGCIVLLPVMGNIVLIDSFYGLPIGVTIHAILLMGGLIYLLFSEYDRLVAFFFQAKDSLPSIDIPNNYVKNSIRFSVIYLPLILIGLYSFPDKHPELTGKYTVEDLKVNHTKLNVTSCEDSLLTTVYIDVGDDFVFEYNNVDNRFIGSYDYEKNTKQLKVVWRYPATQKDTLYATLFRTDKNRLRIKGTMGKNQLEFDLLRYNTKFK